MLEALFVALLVGFAVQALGRQGPARPATPSPCCNALVFKILAGIMWLAPIGAFGAIAGVVGNAGWAAIGALSMFVPTFYATCVVFVVVILGGLLKVTTGFSIFKVLYYLRQEYLLIVATSSSETALPRLIAKMEHLGVSKPVVGIVVPTGYSFNLDGTAMYLTMASLFIGNAMGMPLSWSEQLSLLVFMIVASKGAAGVTGAGLAILGGGLRLPRPGPRPRCRSDRRGRPVHVRSPRPDQLLRQRRRHPDHRQLGQGDRPRPGRPGVHRRGPLRRHRHARRAHAAEHRADVEAYKTKAHAS